MHPLNTCAICKKGLAEGDRVRLVDEGVAHSKCAPEPEEDDLPEFWILKLHDEVPAQ